jgi:hypothetical protein
MEIKGRVTHILPEQSGEGRNGTWRKQEYVIEIPGTYPKSVCFDIWGANIDAFAIKQGEEINVSFDLESREYNGRWFTNVKAWKISRDQQAPAQNASSGPPPKTESWPTPADEISSGGSNDFDDLPF